MRWLQDPFALLSLLQDLLRGSKLAGMDLGFPTMQRGAALSPGGNILGDCSCFVDSSDNSPKCFPWAEGKANRGIPKTPAWHCKFACEPICRARRAQQSIPETSETGRSHCRRAGTANATWGLILAAKSPLGDGCRAAGAQGFALREGCERELPRRLALQSWGHAEGSGADVCKLFDQKGL